MNWRRILIIVTLGGSLILLGGLAWLRLESAGSRFTSGTAIIVVQFENQYPRTTHVEADNTTIRERAADLQTFMMILRSQVVSRRVIVSLNSDELARLLGGKFLQTGQTPFSGVRVDPVRQNGEYIRITSSHRDPIAAQLAAERLYAEFLAFFRENQTKGSAEAIRYLSERKAEQFDNVNKADVALARAQSTRDTIAIRDAENSARIARQLLRNIEERIASTAEVAKTPTTLPLHVVEARLVSGPFWNRTETDFTFEVAQLERR